MRTASPRRAPARTFEGRNGGKTTASRDARGARTRPRARAPRAGAEIRALAARALKLSSVRANDILAARLDGTPRRIQWRDVARRRVRRRRVHERWRGAVGWRAAVDPARRVADRRF